MQKPMNMYPPMDEILTSEPEISQKSIEATKLWKHKFYKGWSTLNNGAKTQRLRILFGLLTAHEELNLNETKIEETNFYAWSPTEQKLYMNTERPSIISTLHEFGHRLHGRSELDACRFSVWLFKKVFPNSFKKLTADGHLLKQK